MELDRMFVRLFVIHNLPSPVLYALRVTGLYHAKLAMEPHKGFMKFMERYCSKYTKETGIKSSTWRWKIDDTNFVLMTLWFENIHLRHIVHTKKGVECNRRWDSATTQLDILRFQLHIERTFATRNVEYPKEETIRSLRYFLSTQSWTIKAGVYDSEIWSFGNATITLVITMHFVTVRLTWRDYNSSESITTTKDLEETKERILRLMHAETHNLYP